MRTVNTSSLYKKSSDTSVMEAVPSRGYFDQESSPFEDQPDEEIAEDFMALNGVSIFKCAVMLHIHVHMRLLIP